MPRRFLVVFIVLFALSFACSGDEGGPASSGDAAITPVVSPAAAVDITPVVSPTAAVDITPVVSPTDAVVSGSESPTPSTTPILAQTP